MADYRADDDDDPGFLGFIFGREGWPLGVIIAACLMWLAVGIVLAVLSRC
jgi:hypothetical protein